MPRRLFALLVGLSVWAAGCGSTAGGGMVALPEDQPATPASAQRVDPATARQAFGLLKQLDQAWNEQDCATVDDLTAGAENALGGRACEATRNGRPAPSGEPTFLLPRSGNWFAALADKAYYVFTREGDRWRLAMGPVRLLGAAPSPAEAGPASAVRAKLVPQRHLTYLTDPAGVSGVTFPTDDPVAGLLRELTTRPAKLRPDSLKVDVELSGEPVRTLALEDGSMLVFHALRIVYTQKPGAGRSSLAAPLYPAPVLRAFGLKPNAPRLTVTELVILATQVSPKNRLTTVGLRRALSTIS